MPPRSRSDAPQPAAPVARWGVVVPVKRLPIAKSRLGAYGGAGREALALAFACDVVAQALACPGVQCVLVVTDDDRAAAHLAALGARVVPDLPASGLNAALEHGAALLAADEPGWGLAAVSSDLPALRAADLDAVLQAVPAGRRAFVSDACPDLQAQGTTLLLAAPGTRLDPRFGTASRRAHLASGAQELLASPALHQDVDTPADLQRVRRLGVGPFTRRACRQLDSAGVGPFT